MLLIRRRMAPRSMRQTGSQRKLGGNARSFLSRYSVPGVGLVLQLGGVTAIGYYARHDMGLPVFNSIILRYQRL